MQKPTVGRIVHFFPATTDNLYRGGQPLAALITHVWSETCVNLSVFHANGDVVFGRTSVLLWASGSRPDAGFAAWPAREGTVLEAKLDTASTAKPLPTAPDDVTEQFIQESGADTAPRVKPAEVLAEIIGETYTVLPSGRVTVCELTLRNGFTVRGESAVVFAENFDAEIGRKVARENAVREIWQLLWFRLRDKQAGAPKPNPVDQNCVFRYCPNEAECKAHGCSAQATQRPEGATK